MHKEYNYVSYVQSDNSDSDIDSDSQKWQWKSNVRKDEHSISLFKEQID